MKGGEPQLSNLSVPRFVQSFKICLVYFCDNTITKPRPAGNFPQQQGRAGRSCTRALWCDIINKIIKTGGRQPAGKAERVVILGIDPGYAIVGWGVVDCTGGRFTVRGYGAIATPAGMDFPQRLRIIYEDMNHVLDKYQPQVLSIEKLYFTNNKTTGIDVAQARGVILLSCAQRGLEVAEYTPMQVKQAVAGYGKAVKHQVMEMTRAMLRLPQVPKPDDTADALALAICHGHCAGSALSRRLWQEAAGR